MGWLSKHKGAIVGGAIGSVLPGVGTAIGAGGGAAYDERKRKQQRAAMLKAQRNSKEFAGDPNVAAIEAAGNRAGATGGDFSQIMGDIAQNFRGSSRHLAEHFQRFRPLILSQLLKTKAAKDLLETDRFAQGAYAPGANMIESATNRGLRSLRGSLALNGLTAGGVYPGLEASMRFQAASSRAALLNQVQMEQLQNRYNLQRDIAQMQAGLPITDTSANRQDYTGIWAALMQSIGQLGAAGISRIGTKSA